MRMGVFADVHSNLEALQSALSFFATQQIQQYLFIGDLVGYGANPNECIELIKDLKCQCVAGNHDYGSVGKTDIENFNSAAKQALLWTKTELNQPSKDFLNNLPLTNIFDGILLVHSSPRNPDAWHYILSLKQAQEEFRYFKEQICFIGHSHYPFAIVKEEKKDTFTVINEQKFEIKGAGFRYLINVGSVGQPRDGDNRTCVLILDTKTKYIEFSRLEYDIKLAQTKILRAGLPPILAYRLSEGK